MHTGFRVRMVVARELRERWRDGRTSLAGGMVVVLLLIGLAIGFKHQQQSRSEQLSAQSDDYRDWLNQDRRHPHDAAHQGMHAFKPEVPLAVVDAGITPYIGNTIWLQAHRQSEVKFRPAQDATGLQRFGDLSASWILQLLGPLLVIVLGFNTFAGEREQGILRQTLSLGVSPLQLLVGKAIALCANLGVLLLPACLVAASLVTLGAAPGERVDTLLRFGALTGGYALYLSSFMLLVLGVSAASSSSRVAITVLLALWIGQVVIAPRVMAEASRLAFPSPTRLEFNDALAADLKATSDRNWMQHFGTTERWSAAVPLNQWGQALKWDDQASYQVYDRQYGKLWSTWEAQQAVQEWSGVLLPLLAIRAFSMGMAGTDFDHHRNFTAAAERHRRVIQDKVSEDLVAQADPLGNQHFAYQAGRDFWAKVPPFEYRTPHIDWAVRHNWLSLIALLVNLSLAAVWAYWAVLRQRAL